MKKICENLFSFCETAIKYISLVPLAILFIACLFYRNTITFDIFETSIILSNGIGLFITVAFAIPLLYLLYQFLQYVPETALFIAMSLLYVASGTYIFLSMNTVLRQDSGICYANALNFVEGIYSNLQPGEYFYKMPHQLSLVTYNCLLISLSTDVNVFYFSNLLWIILTNLFIWFIVRALYEDKTGIRKMTILLTFFFLPQFFYSVFVYAQVPGLCFLVGALYFGILCLKTGKKRYLAPFILFLAISCTLGMNYIIGGVALVIILLLDLLRTKKLFPVLVITAIVAGMILPNKLITAYYEQAADTDLSQGIPFTLYFAMGLQENEDAEVCWRANGWYNDYTSHIYLENNCDPVASSQVAWDYITERLGEFARDPLYSYTFFKEKLITTWCDPTFQSIWSGPLIVFGNSTDSALLHALYSGGPIFADLSAVMNVLVVLIFGFSLWYTVFCTFLRKRALNSYELFAVLFFLGGFFFHMFWETKSRYVYFYVLMLIPYACCGMQVLWAKVDHYLSRHIVMDRNHIRGQYQQNSRHQNIDNK